MFDLMRIQGYLKSDLSLINENLANITKRTHGLTHDIFVHITTNGKRIRPMLLILIAKILGIANNSDVINAATAVELIHTASLLHDDVIDKTIVRREKKTANFIWGDKEAILVGDNIFTESFIAMMKSQNFQAMESLIQTSHLLTKGEILQLEKRASIISLQEYEAVIYYKTSALFECCGGLAAIFAKHDDVILFQNLGKNIGMAFQVIDDIMDYTSRDSGKNIGTDFYEYKVTLPIIFLLDGCASEKQMILDHFLRKKDGDLNIILNAMKRDLIIEKCQNYARKYIIDAITFINTFPKSEERDVFLDFLETFHARSV